MLTSDNHSNPVSYTVSYGQSSSPYNENPSSSGHDEELLSLSSHFPFSFPAINDLILDHVVPQKQLTFGVTGLPHVSEAATDITAVITNNTNIDEQIKLKAQPQPKMLNPRNRTGKKDRHSKIYTACGPRDRRMRLSLPISRAFFNLQDMLGFDKPSKTIEWLLTKSKEAIKELVTRKRLQIKDSSGLINDELSMSQCFPLGFQTEETPGTEDRKGMITEGAKLRTGSHSKRNSSKALHCPLARESRDKARAKARERTRQKMMIRGLRKSKHYFTDTLQGGEERLSSHDHQKAFPYQLVAEVGETSTSHLLQHNQMGTSQYIMENFFGTPVISFDPCSQHDLANTTSISGGLESNNFFSNFRGNCWDLNNTRVNSDCRAVKNKDSGAGNYPYDQTLSSIFMTTSDIQFQPQA